MNSTPQIQNIEPSRVVHELISKPLGWYLIRASTGNDDILSKIKSESESHSYVVLSVRVDENIYGCPIMNYRLSLNDVGNSTSLLEQNNNELPELIEECVFQTEDTNWEIDLNLFDRPYTSLFSKNGVGSKGKITACNFPHGRIDVYNKSFENDEQSFQHEFSLLKNLSYFHIVSFYGICSESDQIKHLVLANNGESLKSQYSTIKCTDGIRIKQLATIGYQIACGMIYLDYKHVIHRDLHAGNILIDSNNFIRIADFEHAIVKEDDDERYQQSIKTSKKTCQPRRSAPECLPSPPELREDEESEESLLAKFSSKSDVWAYGLIFIELIIDENEDIYPYLPIKPKDEDTIQLVEHVKIDRKIHEKPDDCSKNFYKILQQCWTYFPEDRISFVDVRNEMMKLYESTDN